MEKGFQDLIKVLQAELSVYTELLKLAKKKTDVLTRGDVELLNKITSIEQEMILKIGQMEGQRFEIVKSLADYYKKEVSDLNAEFITEVIPDDISQEYSQICNKMIQVLKELDEKNRINEKLIRNALDYIKFSLEVIAESGRQEMGYSAAGRTEENTIHLIDKKA